MQTSFVLAINRNFRNQKGEVDTDFVLCTVWGRTAENTAKHCGKGSLIGVGGRIQSRTYERADGKRVYVTEVIADDIRFLATKNRTHDNLYSEPDASEASSLAGEEATEHFQLPEKEMEGLPIF